MFSKSSRQLMKIVGIQVFIRITLARVLPQMDLSYKSRITPDSRFSVGPILTPVKFLKLKNKQMPERARAQDLQNSANNGGMQPEYLEPVSASPKRIRIELARGSNKHVSITHRSGRRIHLTLRGRQDTQQASPRQVRMMFKNRPQNVAMDTISNSVNVNEFPSETTQFRKTVGVNAGKNQRGSSQIVLFRTNSPNRMQKRVIIRPATGSGSSNRRVLRIHFVRNNNGNDIVQRGVTRTEINMPTTKVDQYSQVNRMKNGGHVEVTPSLTQGQGQNQVHNPLQGQFELQGQLSGEVLAEIKGKIESLLQGQLQGMEEPDVVPTANGRASLVSPTSSPSKSERSTTLPVDIEAEEI
ncbi:uncharacterized protein LOC132562040 [Ylistrum balloti]|uniref:uncharacterized protein LOC132562040 n=1 Tax=Ylistrum balloti TaxID=509963 RepID=UPI002905A6E0|nr:uncharacterized protein LOC132562040 [Ylistrum balloti]